MLFIEVTNPFCLDDDLDSDPVLCMLITLMIPVPVLSPVFLSTLRDSSTAADFSSYTFNDVLDDYFF